MPENIELHPNQVQKRKKTNAERKAKENKNYTEDDLLKKIGRQEVEIDFLGYLYSFGFEWIFSRCTKKTVFGILRSAIPLVTAEKVQMPDFAQLRKATKSN